MVISAALLASLLLAFPYGSALAGENSPLSVVASIKPLHSLVSSLMQGSGGKLSLIVSGGASPHTYNLKPSDARKISTADVIFWIGPSMEGFLEKPLRSLAGRARVVALLPKNNGQSPAIWLSPIKAAAMVKTMAATLAAADPGNAGLYRRNAALLSRRLNNLYGEIKNLLKPVRSKPFIVFHDAYDHLAEAFGLNIAGAVTIRPGRPPGARRIARLRRLIRSGGVSCLFAEPQFDSRRLEMIIGGGANARVGILDPLGAGIPAGKDLYFKLMRANARALVDCLEPTGELGK